MNEVHLDRLLGGMDVRLHAVAFCELRQGQALVFEPFDVAVLHYVLTGSGIIEVEGHPPIPFHANMILMVPPNRRKRISMEGSVDVEIVDIGQSLMTADGLLRIGKGEEEPHLVMACGFQNVMRHEPFGFLDALDAPLVEDISSLEIVTGAFRQMLSEIKQPHFATQALTETLMKQCLILALRGYADREGFISPVFSHLPDARLMRATMAIMKRPAATHSVASLARDAGMSRSAFAKKFSAAFQESPMDFLQKTRLHHAARLLTTTKMPVKLVASSVGFSSRSHFSRAFRTSFGVDPSEYRKTNSK